MDNIIIKRAEEKAKRLLMNGGKCMVAISGGADSDCMLDLLYRINHELEKIGLESDMHYVFFDTGLEFSATREHLSYLENRYGIQIERAKAFKSIPYTCNKHGIPFWSKRVSDMIQRLQKHNFTFENDTFEILWKKYPKSKAALRWFTSDFPTKSVNISYIRGLHDFLVKNPPDFKISACCCDYAKKKTAHNYIKENGIDINCTGVRRSEGGTRATAYKTCYNTDDDLTYFRPLFWFTNSDRMEYEKKYGIVHSLCYTEYGMNRTGCAGCPFARKYKDELAIINHYESDLFKACWNIFGKSYLYREEFEKHRK